MIWRAVRVAALSTVATLALVAVPTASAAPATLKPVTEANGVILADWSPLPAGASSWELQISSTADFAFPYALPVTPPTDASLSVPLSQGTYYVRVITTPTLGLCETSDPGCQLEISNVMTVTVPPPAAHPPVIKELRGDGGHITVKWTVPDGYESFELEIGASSTTDDLGYLVEPVDYYIPAPGDTSYTSIDLAPGTYWVHVSSILAGCFDCFAYWTDPTPVTISAPVTTSTSPPPPSLPPPPDKVLALGAVTASSSQKVGKLNIALNPGETVKVKLSGTVSVPGGSKVYRFTTIDKTIGAGKTKLSPKLPRKAQKAVKKALERKKKLKAKLTLIVADNAGNSKKSNYTVRLKP